MKRKLTTILILAIVIIISADGIPPEGSGTEFDPFLIETLDNLLWLSTTETAWDSLNYFQQTENIDAIETASWNDGSGFCPIGIDDETPFMGNYDGDNFSINNLSINRPEQEYVGFFGYTEQADIQNMGFRDCFIQGEQYTGGIIGRAYYSRISSCYTFGRVNGAEHSGGLIGYSEYSELNTSYAEGGVSGENYTGGLIGYARNSSISNSYATLRVFGASFVGGIAGFNIGSAISNCYSTGLIEAEQTFGGLIGFNTDEINNCIWNIETSGQDEGLGYNDGGVISNLLGATSEEMHLSSTYTDIGWDFVGESINGDEDIWGIDSLFNDGYPYLTEINEPVDNDQVLELSQNLSLFPNPFNPITNITFEISNSSNIVLTVYNIKGQQVETLADRFFDSGKHSLTWDAQKCSSGIYLINMKTGSSVITKRITLLK